MLIIKVTSPDGAVKHMAGAFPSACGKTNLAMLEPTHPRLEGRDDRRRHLLDEVRRGRQLYAINPEAGFFGVAPGTSMATNANAIRTLYANCIFTNCALTDDGDVWWEGLTDQKPAHLIDWTGQGLDPRVRDPGRPRQRPLHRPGRPGPGDRPQLGGSGRRPDRRDHVRRPSSLRRAARARGLRLGARRVPGLDHELGDDRRRLRDGRQAALRSVRDAALLRLQHGRLLGPLAQDRREGGRPAAAHLPGQLVPQGRRRQVHVARLRREQPRDRVDLRPLLRRG